MISVYKETRDFTIEDFDAFKKLSKESIFEASSLFKVSNFTSWIVASDGFVFTKLKHQLDNV